jgi:hypothetical protein
MPLASTTRTTGQPVRRATSAVEPLPSEAPSNRPMTPSPITSSAPAPARAAKADRVSGRIAQASRLRQGRPLAALWKAGSM